MKTLFVVLLILGFVFVNCAPFQAESTLEGQSHPLRTGEKPIKINTNVTHEIHVEGGRALDRTAMVRFG
ncbi:hypothetical protein QR680_003856 [Steinernema hermaphroditum]|uniref:Uncharacterized protein n=1 Tax=Steinernema hermaphroditum TaxID=289476 RepID=A0AA39LS98_9BILA|nr:hypothetical protein QR680_003856 [Steinernema hermaphroditum]